MQLIGIPKGEEREKQTEAFSRNNGSIFSKFDQNDKLTDPLFFTLCHLTETAYWISKNSAM